MVSVEIFTDGSCIRNPGPGGWAALLRTAGRERELVGGEAATTNNRMELMAVIAALESLKRPCDVVLYSDSRYVLDGISKWMPNWRRRNWRTSSGDPVKNRDLWQRLHHAAEEHRVEWNWVRGHAGHPENERVDDLANAEAARQVDAGANRRN